MNIPFWHYVGICLIWLAAAAAAVALAWRFFLYVDLRARGFKSFRDEQEATAMRNRMREWGTSISASPERPPFSTWVHNPENIAAQEAYAKKFQTGSTHDRYTRELADPGEGYRFLDPGEIAPVGYEMRYTTNLYEMNWFPGGCPGERIFPEQFACCQYRAKKDAK